MLPGPTEGSWEKYVYQWEDGHVLVGGGHVLTGGWLCPSRRRACASVRRVCSSGKRASPDYSHSEAS